MPDYRMSAPASGYDVLTSIVAGIVLVALCGYFTWPVIYGYYYLITHSIRLGI